MASPNSNVRVPATLGSVLTRLTALNASLRPSPSAATPDETLSQKAVDVWVYEGGRANPDDQ